MDRYRQLAEAYEAACDACEQAKLSLVSWGRELRTSALSPNAKKHYIGAHSEVYSAAFHARRKAWADLAATWSPSFDPEFVRQADYCYDRMYR